MDLKRKEARNDRTQPHYLYFYVITDGFNARMAGLERGANYPAIRDSDVLKSWLPLPPGRAHEISSNDVAKALINSVLASRNICRYNKIIIM